jgi:hypothetical protein
MKRVPTFASPPGRPKGEFRSAQLEGTPMNADDARERRLLAWLVLGNLVAVVLVAGLSAVALKVSHDALRQQVIDSTQNLRTACASRSNPAWTAPTCCCA